MNKCFFIFFVFLLSACKMNSSDLEAGVQKKIGEIGAIETRAFTVDEMKIIKDTCNKLTNKREYFNSFDDLKVRFNFNLETSNCGVSKKQNSIIQTVLSNSNSTDMEYYIDDRSDYLRSVVTDQSVGIKYLCDNKEARNLNNFFIDGGTSFSYNVFINQGFNHFEIVKSIKDKSGKFITKSADAIDFITNTYQASNKFLGMEKEHIRNILCENNTYYYIKQTWMNN